MTVSRTSVALKRFATRIVVEQAKMLASLPYRREVAALKNLEQEHFWDYQAARLRNVYDDAVRHVPHYATQPHLYPPNPNFDQDLLATLQQLPTVPKSAVKHDPSRFWRDPAPVLTFSHTTSGSTGAPMRVRVALRDRGYTSAILQQRYLELAGTRTPRVIRLGGFLNAEVAAGEVFLKVPASKFAYLSVYDLGARRARDIRDSIQAFRPQVLHGYASALHQLALLFDNDNFPLEPGTFTVISNSETLLPEQRRDIERVMRTKVYNEYGSQEGQHLALECAYGSMHVHPARGIIEILSFDSDDPVAIGEMGRVVVTGLMNRAMPLLRYDIGDSAVSTGFSQNCTCGLRWPTIGDVVGRTDDLVRTRDGRRVGILSDATKPLTGIRESQLVQTGYGRFLFRIVPEDAEITVRAHNEQSIRSYLRARLQEDVAVNFEYISSIPRGANGKRPAVVVRIDESEQQ